MPQCLHPHTSGIPVHQEELLLVSEKMIIISVTLQKTLPARLKLENDEQADDEGISGHLGCMYDDSAMC